MSVFFSQPLKCVVLCAGRGSRLNQPDIPKSMVKVHGKPVLAHIVDYWKKFTEEFVFVVGYKKEVITQYAGKMPVSASFIEQKELKGIGYAVSLAEEQAGEKFILILGDCICRGDFSFPEGMEQGIGAWETENTADIERSYSVETEGGKVVRVVEKPKVPVNNLCGMGFYFFDRAVFDYIKKTPPSPLRNEIEITDVIQSMIDGGEKVSPVFFKGKYLNITYMEDLSRAEKLLKDENSD